MIIQIFHKSNKLAIRINMSEDEDYLLYEDGDSVDNDEIEIDDLKVGQVFSCEDGAVKSIENWGFKTLCALTKIRYRQGKTENGVKVKGRRCYACPHGIERKKTGGGKRPGQRYKFTNCPVKVNLNEQDDGSWEVTTCVLEHRGHVITSKGFFSHQQSRKLQARQSRYGISYHRRARS